MPHPETPSILSVGFTSPLPYRLRAQILATGHKIFRERGSLAFTDPAGGLKNTARFLRAAGRITMPEKSILSVLPYCA
ncbi:MAG: hypothetical protein ACOX88_06310 [Christensenellales bacterium]|jgi:hypothetical protein